MNELMFNYSIEGRYFIDYIFIYHFNDYDYKSCWSILYLNKQCFHFFINYYNVKKVLPEGDIYKPTNKILEKIYKKYYNLLNFSGSYVLSKMQNITFTDIDIYIICDFLNFSFIQDKYREGFKYYYTKNNRINDLIFDLKKINFKIKQRSYNFSNYKIMVMQNKNFKEQFIFIGNDKNKKKQINYFGIRHNNYNFEKFLLSFDISCVQIYINSSTFIYENNLFISIIKSKYPQIFNNKKTIYKHNINIKNEFGLHKIEIFQPYRLIKYIKKGYTIQKNNTIINFTKYLEKLLDCFNYFYNLSILSIFNLKVVDNIIFKEYIFTVINKLLYPEKMNKFSIDLCLFNNNYLYLTIENDKIDTLKSSFDFYYEINKPIDPYENETGDNLTHFYMTIDNIKLFVEHFKF